MVYFIAWWFPYARSLKPSTCLCTRVSYKCELFFKTWFFFYDIVYLPDCGKTALHWIENEDVYSCHHFCNCICAGCKFIFLWWANIGKTKGGDKVAPYCLAFPSFAFNYGLPDSVAEKLLLQTSKSSISQQSGIQMTSRFVAMETREEDKNRLFWTI